MDGTLAVIWLLTSLTDMSLNDCPTGCLQEQVAQSRLSLQWGEVLFQERGVDHEIYIGLDSARSFGPFQPVMAASLTGNGDAWIGYGAKWTSQDIVPGRFFVETSLMPGLFAAGRGPNIGGALQFRSAFGVGYTFDNGGTVTVLYDHRSNADTQALNPGLETLGVRYAVALK